MLLLYVLLGIAGSFLICLSAGYSGWVLAAFLLLFALAGVLALLILHLLVLVVSALFVDKHTPSTEDRPFYRWILAQSSGMLLQLCNVRLQVEGLEKLPDTPYLLVCNHRSGFDPIVTLWLLRKSKTRLCFISKPENYNIPIAAQLMAANGYLPIDRNDDRKALRTILTAAERMKQGSCSFCIYPEGTRSKDGSLLPFRNGCFKAAQRAQVPVVVASILGSEQIAKRAVLRRTRVSLRISCVIDVETVLECKTAELSEIVRDVMEDSIRIMRS